MVKLNYNLNKGYAKMKRQQNGYTPQIIIMAILGLVIMALIGATIYQSLNKNKTADKTVEVKDDADNKADADKTAEVKVEVKNKTFENSLYTFDYPDIGWEVRTDVNTNGVFIETPDFEADSTSVIKGASISLGRIAGNATAEQTMNSMKAKSLISDYDVIDIDGQSAYEFRCRAYCNYQILFDKNGKGYEIKLNSFNDDEFNAYTLLTATLKIK